MTESLQQRFEADMELRRRLIGHLVVNWNEELVHTATDSFADLLVDADNEMLEALLKPLVVWSDYWPQRMAAEVLGLDLDEEYDCRELFELFERNARGSEPDKGKAKVNWKA